MPPLEDRPTSVRDSESFELFHDESADISFSDYLVTWVPAEFVKSVETQRSRGFPR